MAQWELLWNNNRPEYCLTYQLTIIQICLHIPVMPVLKQLYNACICIICYTVEKKSHCRTRTHHARKPSKQPKTGQFGCGNQFEYGICIHRWDSTVSSVTEKILNEQTKVLQKCPTSPPLSRTWSYGFRPTHNSYFVMWYFLKS